MPRKERQGRKGGYGRCAADHLAAPTPNEEPRKLRFRGRVTAKRWCIPSRWTEGGPATSRVVARIDSMALIMIQGHDARCATARKNIRNQRGGVTIPTARSAYKLFWHEFVGYYRRPRHPGLDRQDTDHRARFAGAAKARHGSELSTTTSYSMKIQFSRTGRMATCTGFYRRIPGPLDRFRRRQSKPCPS